MASNDKTAGGLTARINQRHLFADWTRKKKAAQLGIQTPLVLQSGSGATKQASIFNYIADGAQFTTASEQSQYLASVRLPSEAPAPPTPPTPIYTTVYTAFYGPFTFTWPAPATIQSPITYWIIGGGGGGAGAYDQRGNGGGGGGAFITGTYAVVGGTAYTIVVGAGGAGGTGRGSGGGVDGTAFDGTDGTSSSFDAAGGGPVAAGGGKGLIGAPFRTGGTGGLVTTGGGGGDGGGRGGGGGGAGGNGTNGSLGLGTGAPGGEGISFTIPSLSPQVYGEGGNGGENPLSDYTVGADGSAYSGKGGGGGSAAAAQPPAADGLIKMGGDGGSGLVVIEYSAIL